MATDEITTTATPKKKGRKGRPSGEERSKKFSNYFTEKLYQDISDLAFSLKKNVPDLIFDITSEYVEKNRDRLEKFRELWN